MNYTKLIDMKTKAEIVQRLLDEKKINAEEAVILLTKDVEFAPIQYVPFPQPYPDFYPSWPTITVNDFPTKYIFRTYSAVA